MHKTTNLEHPKEEVKENLHNEIDKFIDNLFEDLETGDILTLIGSHNRTKTNPENIAELIEQYMHGGVLSDTLYLGDMLSDVLSDWAYTISEKHGAELEDRLATIIMDFINQLDLVVEEIEQVIVKKAVVRLKS